MFKHVKLMMHDIVKFSLRPIMYANNFTQNNLYYISADKESFNLDIHSNTFLHITIL